MDSRVQIMLPYELLRKLEKLRGEYESVTGKTTNRSELITTILEEYLDALAREERNAQRDLRKKEEASR